MKDIVVSSINSAYSALDVWQNFDIARECERLKDDAIFEAARASVVQSELLLEQLDALKEQNKLLKEMYDGAKVDAEENKKEARHNKIFGWVSFAVGTVIGIAGVLVGVFI